LLYESILTYSRHVASQRRYSISYRDIYNIYNIYSLREFILFTKSLENNAANLIKEKYDRKWGSIMGAYFKLSISTKNKRILHIIRELEMRGLNISELFCQYIAEGFDKDIKEGHIKELIDALPNTPKMEFFE
jgi:hypothetical protein